MNVLLLFGNAVNELIIFSIAVIGTMNNDDEDEDMLSA